jgi:DNA-binding Lrp family transcriptional regulator
MNEKTIELLRELQNGFKLETRPFKRMANKLGCSEEEVIKMIKDCIDQGIIRRIGAAVRPDKTGYTANAMVVWKVPFDRIDQVGQAVASMREVSHCYERDCPVDWNYNFFTMIHAKTHEELQTLICRISDEHDLPEYSIYKSLKELKKTSMKYFPEEVKS